MTSPYYADDSVTLYHGDALETAQTLGAGSVDCIVTSPPYFGLRDYGVEGQYGLEASPSLYVARMRRLFSEMHRVLADDGTLWLNIGDSYASSPKGSLKNLLGIPWRVAFALQDDGWILRNAIIWNKPNAMPESVTDRLSGRYEHVFLFSKSRRYRFDLDAIRMPYPESSQARYKHSFAGTTERLSEARIGGDNRNAAQLAPNPKGCNPGDVWTIPTQPFPGAHFAVFPIALPQRCIQAGCKPGGTVLDPFNGSGTTGLAAQRTGRKYVGIDINSQYLELTLRNRLAQNTLDFQEGA